MSTMNPPRPVSRSVPRGGWLRPRDGVVVFAETPPRDAGADVVLSAARFASDRTIGADVATWIEELVPADLTWSAGTTASLLDLLRRGNASSWAFLAQTDAIRKMFPGLDDGFDPADHLGAVELLRDTTAVANAHSDTLLLGAFFGSLYSDSRDMAEALARVGISIDAVEEIVDLVSGARVLLASVEREHLVIDARFLNHIAHGLRRPGIVERSRLLADAIGKPEPWQHAAMIEITTGVQLALAHPELLDESAESLDTLLRRQAVARTVDPAIARRIAEAPTAYVLAHEPMSLAEHVRLIEPAPNGSTVRVTVEPQSAPNRFVVNVACVDRPGLLSRLTAVLAAEHVSVDSASLATWPDDSVLDSFIVTAATPPDPTRLASLFEGALESDPPIPGLSGPSPTVALDNSLHPLHSVLRVTGRDQLGLLSVVTHAISTAGSVIHHAVIRTTAGAIDDDFEVSRPDGSKIDMADLDRILRHLAASDRTDASYA